MIPIVMFLVIGGVMVLRPVTKKLGMLIEAMAKERTARLNGGAHGLDEAQIVRLTATLERLDARMDRIDDRVGFVERLVEDRPRSRLTG